MFLCVSLKLLSLSFVSTRLATPVIPVDSNILGVAEKHPIKFFAIFLVITRNFELKFYTFITFMQM